MKKAICILILGFSVLASGFTETIHVKRAFAMKKNHGNIYVIRVELEDGYHDWYVRSTEYSWKFYGYGSEDVIIVDNLIDIAIDN